MKKILSIVLSVALVMSLFCAVPASVSAADGINAAASTVTYAFDNFEGPAYFNGTEANNEKFYTSGKLTYERITTGGANSSAGALKVSFSGGTPQINAPHKLKDHMNTLTNYTVSFDYKIVTELTQANFRLRVAQYNATASVAYYAVPAAHLTDGEWHTATITVNGSGNDSDSQTAANNGLTLAFSSAGGTTEAVDGGTVELLIDNLFFSRDNAALYGLHHYDMEQASLFDAKTDFTPAVTGYNQRTIASMTVADSAFSSSMLTDPADPTASVLALKGASFVEVGLNMWGSLREGDTVTSVVKSKIQDTVEHSYHIPANENYKVFPKVAIGTGGTGREAYAAYQKSPTAHYLKKGFTVGAVTWDSWRTHTYTQTIGGGANVSGNNKSVYTLRVTDDSGYNLNPQQDRDTDGNKDLSQTTFLFDYITITVNEATATLPKVSNVSATITGNVITANYNYTETNTDAANFSDASYIKVRNKADGKVIAVSNAKTIYIPEEYKDANLELEVVPVCNSTRVIGVPVEADIEKVPEVEPITETTIEKVENNIVITAAEDIVGAELIFVVYGVETNKMLENIFAPEQITVDSQGTLTVAIPEFTKSGDVKVMLWRDTDTTFEPLADLISYPNY